jgi:DNA-binding winged helix-turn-helix (wHTH) protein
MRGSTKVIAFGERELDFGRGELRRDGNPIDIQPTPLRLLLYPVEHRDRVVSRQELLDAIWPGVVVGDEALTTALAEARHAVGDDGGLRSEPRFQAIVEQMGLTPYHARYLKRLHRAHAMESASNDEAAP